MAKCQVCNNPLTGGRIKKCPDCDPFWDKAYDVITNDKRKDVTFDTDQEKNKVLFAREMRKKWKEKDPYYLCPYTLLPMYLKNPVTEAEAKEAEAKGDESKRELREAHKFLVFSPDRIDSNDLYEPGKVEVCTYLGNIMKNSLSKEAFNSVITDMIKDKITIKKDKQLVKMLLMWLSDFYEKTDLTEDELEEHYNKIEEIKKINDEKRTK